MQTLTSISFIQYWKLTEMGKMANPPEGKRYSSELHLTSPEHTQRSNFGTCMNTQTQIITPVIRGIWYEAKLDIGKFSKIIIRARKIEAMPKLGWTWQKLASLRQRVHNNVDNIELFSLFINEMFHLLLFLFSKIAAFKATGNYQVRLMQQSPSKLKPTSSRFESNCFDLAQSIWIGPYIKSFCSFCEKSKESHFTWSTIWYGLGLYIWPLVTWGQV